MERIVVGQVISSSPVDGTIPGSLGIKSALVFAEELRQHLLLGAMSKEGV